MKVPHPVIPSSTRSSAFHFPLKYQLLKEIFFRMSHRVVEVFEPSLFDSFQQFGMVADSTKNFAFSRIRLILRILLYIHISKAYIFFSEAALNAVDSTPSRSVNETFDFDFSFQVQAEIALAKKQLHLCRYTSGFFKSAFCFYRFHILQDYCRFYLILFLWSCFCLVVVDKAEVARLALIYT